MDGTTVVVVIIVALVVLALIALAAWFAARKRGERTEGLRDRFGPEYDRQVEEQGGRRTAESHLSDVADRRDKLDIRDLSEQERTGYRRDWNMVQADFVDNPSGAVHDADGLVGAVMRDRGYPVDDFSSKSDMVAVDHPDIVEHYRAAHDIAGRRDSTTEEHRRAFVHYRALFAELLEDGEHGRHASDDDSQNDRVDLTGHEAPATSAGPNSMRRDTTQDR